MMPRKMMPGLLLGVMDGSSLERRIMRLLDQRAPWTQQRRLLSGAFCAAVVGALSVSVAMVGVQPLVFAQEAKLLHATGPLPKFEVATIKLAVDDGRSQAGADGPTEFFMHNFTIKDMLQMAYDIRSDNQLEGVTGWLTTDRFDVRIKLSPEEIALEDKLEMLPKIKRWQLVTQALLVERFHLKTSESTKDVRVFDLVVAKGGPKLTPSKMVDAPEKSGTKKAVEPPTLQTRGPGKLVATAVPLSLVAEDLSRLPELGAGRNFGGGRMVMDKTGLAGLYDWTLTWSPETAQGAASVNADSPGLFTAMEEQLGLKLVPSKAPVQVLVIDHIERPTEN